MYDMNDVEYARFIDFEKKHLKCVEPTTIGGNIDVICTPTGLGTMYVCRCNWCNEKEDITDYDCW